MITVRGNGNGIADMGICARIPSAKLGPIPPMNVVCSAGPKMKCVSTKTPTEVWEYDEALWDAPEWQELNVHRKGTTTYHFSAEWHIEDYKGTPHCFVTGIAEGDIDGDGIFSRFEMRNIPYSHTEDGDVVNTKLERPYE